MNTSEAVGVLTSSLLTTADVARSLGKAPSTVRRMVAAGVLVPVARIGITHHGAFLFDPNEIRNLTGTRHPAAVEL